jgi:hypothetical protein
MNSEVLQAQTLTLINDFSDTQKAYKLFERFASEVERKRHPSFFEQLVDLGLGLSLGLYTLDCAVKTAGDAREWWNTLCAPPTPPRSVLVVSKPLFTLGLPKIEPVSPTNKPKGSKMIHRSNRLKRHHKKRWLLSAT